VAVDHDGPTALILSRQNLPVLEGTATTEVTRGGYVLHDPDGDAQVVLVATGSEVWLCRDAADRLAAQGIAARVVSLPSWELFAVQDDDYRDGVLPAGVPTLSVEAGVTFGWSAFADDSIGIDHFGASAPGEVALEKFGFTVDHVVERAVALVDATA
jgi:transketolase